MDFFEYEEEEEKKSQFISKYYNGESERTLIVCLLSCGLATVATGMISLTRDRRRLGTTY